MFRRLIVLILISMSMVFLHCDSSPTSPGNDNPTENSGDDGDSEDSDDGGGDEDPDPEPTIIDIQNNYDPFLPYQTLYYYNEDFDLEDYGYEFVWGEDSVDNSYDLYKTFELVYYQDTLAIGDTLSAKVNEWGQWSIGIPNIEPGSYNFTVFINEDLMIKGQAEILPLPYIADPVSYIQTEISEFENMMQVVKQDFQGILEMDYGSEYQEDYKADMRETYEYYLELEQQMMAEFQAASPEELEQLAYYMKAYEEVLTREYEPFDQAAKITDHEETDDPEELYEESKNWLTNAINFSGILNVFWNSDTENVKVGEGDVVETAKTWTVVGQAMSILTGIQERFTKVFALTSDELEAELKGDFSGKIKLSPFTEKGKVWPHHDTLHFEYDAQYRLSFTGNYESLVEADMWSWSYEEVNVLNRELYDLLQDIDLDYGLASLYPQLKVDTLNVSKQVNSKYLELRDIENSTISDISFSELFDIQKDETTGEFILTARKQQNESGNTYYGELETEVLAEYYQDSEFDDNQYLFVATTCPDFSLFMTGDWQLIYYETEDRTTIYEIERSTYYADGTWEGEEYRIFPNGPEWNESFSTGQWRSRCDDGEAWLFWYHNYFGNITYIFKYTGNKDQMFGYCSGLCNKGYNMELRRGW